jgi:hypothetical protein
MRNHVCSPVIAVLASTGIVAPRQKDLEWATTRQSYLTLNGRKACGSKPRYSTAPMSQASGRIAPR